MPSANSCHSASTSAWVLVSSSDRPRRWASIWRRLRRWARAWSCRAAVALPVARVRVSKKCSISTFTPSCCRPALRIAVSAWVRSAICFRPCGPWYTAYMLAMLASSTWAVQMLLVAFSRRMCCSRVCMARRRAVLPKRSIETPTRRPGMSRLNASRVEK
ncbi:hypothetical protein D3C77_452860 [compost metagenome]